MPTVVIGGGQAGLAMGFHLRRLGEQFVILDRFLFRRPSTAPVALTVVAPRPSTDKAA